VSSSAALARAGATAGGAVSRRADRQPRSAATRSIEETIAAMHAHGTTIVMTTHDLGQARRLADRVLFLHHGRLVEDAAAAIFFQQPTSPEATAFIEGELLW
jgi:tungstate transport system ATP-binding protein